MDPDALRKRVESHIRRHELIPPGGAVTCLVSGGADSTCLVHVLRALGYEVAALHVNHGLRGEESEADARFCAEALGAEVVRVAPGATEAELRELRYVSVAASDRLRATGHTASDQVETVLYRLVSSGRPTGIRVRREDGVVRPLLPLWRDETEAYCRSKGSSSASTRRTGHEARPDPRRDPAASAPPAPGRRREPAARARRAARAAAAAGGAARVAGGLAPGRPRRRRAGRARVRPALARARARSTLEGEVAWGAWRIRSELPGLRVRGWRAGDRLAGRSKKVQDVFVDAKIPRSDREAWPLVVRGDEVVAVPGIVEAAGVEACRA